MYKSWILIDLRNTLFSDEFKTNIFGLGGPNMDLQVRRLSDEKFLLWR